MTGSHEARGSIPLSSTRDFKGLASTVSPFNFGRPQLRAHSQLLMFRRQAAISDRHPDAGTNQPFAYFFETVRFNIQTRGERLRWSAFPDIRIQSEKAD